MDEISKYFRPDCPNTENDLVFQVISWTDYDEVSGEIENEVPQYTIYATGVTTNEESVCLKITNFISYYYIRVPEEYQTVWSLEHTEILYKHLKKRLGKFSGGLVSRTLVEKSSLYSFQNGETQKYIRLCFSNSETFRKSRNQFYKPFVLYGLSTIPMEFKMYETIVDPILRFMHIREIRSVGWIKISKGKYFVDDSGIITTEWDNVNPHLINGKECEDIAPFRILSWDIECQTSRGYPEFPDATIPGDYISQIGCGLWIFGKEKHKFILTIFKSDPLEDPENTLILCNNEKDLLIKFCTIIKDIDPDIITGYNTWGFDDQYLYLRLRYHNLLYLLDSMSRIPNIPTKLANKKLSSSAYGSNEFNILFFGGRESVDLIMFIRREYKLDSYKLAKVAIEFKLDKGKDDLPYEIMFKILDKGNDSPAEMATVCNYCTQDAFLVLELMEKLCFIPNSIEMAKSTRVPISWLLLKGQQCKIYSQLAYESRKKNFVIPTIENKKDDIDEDEETEKKLKGATVLTARRGAYYTPIAGLDFKSLYPSIMIAYNLCYSTIVLDPKYLNLPGIEYETISWKQKEDDGSITEFNFTYVQNIKGILPEILTRLWAERNATKKEMKSCKGTFRYTVLNGKQLAIKTTMNSAYGFTCAGKGMFPCKPIGGSVTAKGREMIEQTSRMAEELYSCVTTYGDSVPSYQKVLTCEMGTESSLEIEDLFNKYTRMGVPVIEYINGGRDKEQLLVGDSKILAWTHMGWKKLRRIIRHRTTKKMYRITTDRGTVVVTEDHSLINPEGIQVKPLELKIGDHIMCKSPLLVK